jgi:isopenicillin-N N-acyltransferase-like protein
MLPLVEISSPDPRERGRQYGEQARGQIACSIDFYKGEFLAKSGLAWDEVLARVPKWTAVVEGYHADALEEVRGIADGSGFAVDEILALNGRGELRIGDPFDEGCSSYALLPEASGDGHTYCGQNWDWRVGTKESVCLLRIEQPSKPTIVMQVEAGQVGRQGANSAGIGLNANGLEAPFGFRLGVPSPYIRRKILDSQTMDEALQAAMRSKQSVCANLLFTHRDGVAIDLETTPERHGVMQPTDGVLVHANAFIAYVPPQVADSYRPSSVDSLYRAPRIERVLRTARTATSTAETRATIATALSDHFSYPNSVCTHPDPQRGSQWETLASTIVDLTTGEYLVAHGTPCEHAYEPLPWNLYA